LQVWVIPKAKIDSRERLINSGHYRLLTHHEIGKGPRMEDGCEGKY
jgi:hypothetical protein